MLTFRDGRSRLEMADDFTTQNHRNVLLSYRIEPPRSGSHGTDPSRPNLSCQTGVQKAAN